MRKFLTFSSFTFVCLLFALTAAAQIAPTTNARTYLPGDFVHLIVNAPADTTQITATMPDSTIISLIQGRSTTVWRGIWQVPVDFKKGTYSAKLTAVDVNGDVFEGQTDIFSIGELAMISLVGKPTAEAPVPPPLQEKISVEEAKPAGAAEEELFKRIMKIIALPTTTPPPNLKAEEKKQLVESNLGSGKDFFDKGKLAEAAAYFRIVLYLSPENKEASFYLAQTRELLKNAEEERSRQVVLLVIFGLITFAGVGALLWLIAGIFKRRTAIPLKPAEVLSEEAKEQNWCQRNNWSKKPFTEDIFQKLFTGDNKLEFDGLKNLIKARIESVGGSGVSPFTEPALNEVFRISNGKPKVAFKVCQWAVDQAIERNESAITAELVREYEEIKTATILIADDEEIVRTSLDSILRVGGGYKTEIAFDGEEALRKIKGNTFDLLLLDIAMPKIDGYEILKQVRSTNASIPIIFISGKGTADKVMESLSQYNLTAYIEKPFTMEKVLDTVAKALKK